MRNTSLIAAALLSLPFGTAALAGSDRPGADWMSPARVRLILARAGYTSVTSIKADDGHWEGEGVRNGVRMEFHVDPRTGAITKQERDDD